MLDAEESAELRMLRAKAYGPGEGVSAEELGRLQELEGRSSAGEERLRPGSLSQGEERLRLPSVAQPVSSSAAAPPALNDPPVYEAHGAASHGSLSERSEPKRVERAERVETADAADAADSPDSPDAAEAPRRRWPLLAAASAALLAVGLGIGWGIWGWDSRASALAAAHGSTQAELEAEEVYDPGTVVPVAEEHGVVVWKADRSDGEELCVIVTAPDQNSHGCISYEQLADSAWPHATASVPEGAEEAGHQLGAGLIPTATGELVPFIQIWNVDSSTWESQYSDEELSQLRAVEAAGHMGSALGILGHDGDTVVWSSWENGGLCVIAPTDAGIIDACADDPGETLSLTAPVDGVTTRYVVTQPETRPPQLTVYKDVDVDYYFGDKDEPMFDDLFVDDKTAEFSE